MAAYSNKRHLSYLNSADEILSPDLCSTGSGCEEQKGLRVWQEEEDSGLFSATSCIFRTVLPI